MNNTDQSYYQKNRAVLLEYGRNYYYKNPNYFKDYYEKNKEHLRNYQRNYMAKKRGQIKFPTQSKNHVVKSKFKSKLKLKTEKIARDIEDIKLKAEAFKLSLIQTSNPDYSLL